VKMKALFLILLSCSVYAKVSVQDVKSLDKLESLFRTSPRTAGLQVMIKKVTLKEGGKAVPTLIKVMKSDEYPEQNRWTATMLLAQIMGKKSAPFIAKFTDHPHWMMRVASLKALAGLGQKDYLNVHAKSLKDDSLIVRVQALDNISKMKMTALAPHVWKMMYDPANYVGDNGKRKRASIIKSVIRTLGDLKFKDASKSFAKLIQNKKYEDLSEELDYSLEQFTGMKSPDQKDLQRQFWKKELLSSTSGSRNLR